MFLELAIGTGVVWALSKAVSKVVASNKLLVDVTGRVHKITFSKITVVVDAVVKNPTQQTFRFRRPFVTLSYKKNRLGASDVQQTIIVLEPYTQTTIKDIPIEIQLLQLPAVAVDAFKILQTAQGTLEIDVNCIVPVVTPAGDVPAPYDDKIVL